MPANPLLDRIIDLRNVMERVREAARAAARSPQGAQGGSPAALPDCPSWELLELEDEDFIRRLYWLLFGRAADESGFAYFLGRLRAGEATKLELIKTFRASPEAAARRVEVQGLIPLLEAPLPVIDPLTPLRGEEGAPAQVAIASQMLALDDEEFLRNAFRTFLRREPDEPTFGSLLQRLRDGEVTKFEALDGLRRSPEGRARAVPHRGFRLRSVAASMQRIPIAGSILRGLVALAGFPWLPRKLARLEGVIAGERAARLDTVAALDARLVAIRAALEQQRIALRTTAEGAERAIAWTGARGVSAAALDAALRRRDQTLAAIQEEIFRATRESVGNKQAMAELRAAQGAAQGKMAAIEERLPPLPGPGFERMYVALEDRFRGTGEEIRDRLRIYLPAVRESGAGTTGGPIVDIGCGRGEWLALLAEAGLEAQGIDSNPEMIARCAALGLHAVQADALQFLQRTPEASLGAVTAFHVVEHLPLPTLVRLFEESLRVLRPGGLLVFETPNPENLVVGACNFYVDPTHVRPLPPVFLQFVAEHAGFARVELMRLGSAAGSVPEAFPPGDPNHVFNPFIHALRHNFFSGPDYAVIARKAG